jgi:hypothetical protein
MSYNFSKNIGEIDWSKYAAFFDQMKGESNIAGSTSAPNSISDGATSGNPEEKFDQFDNSTRNPVKHQQLEKDGDETGEDRSMTQGYAGRSLTDAGK